jgi:hypothetical protein
MFMPLNIFGINTQLIDVYAVEYVQHEHSCNLDVYAVEYVCLVMPKTVNGITIQLGWLCR